MQYRLLGRSGLHVSTVSLGTATFGVRPLAGDVDALVGHALELGINFFDCANSYGNRPHFDQPGAPPAHERKSAEELLGSALRGRRAEIVLATKVDEPIGPGPNDRGLSRSHVMAQVETSLRRLQTDYIDVYYAHHPDPNTPIETMVRIFNELIYQGKIRYYALSQFSPSQVIETLWAADRLGLEAPIGNQVAYSLAYRRIEQELMGACARHDVSILPFSPLGGGLLGGIASARRDVVGNARWGGSRYSDADLSFAEGFEKLSRSWGLEPAEVAIAWLLAHPSVASAVVGSTTAEGLEQNARGAGVELSVEQIAELDALSAGR